MNPLLRMALILMIVGSFMNQGCVSPGKKKSAPELQQQIVKSMMDDSPSLRWSGVESLIDDRKSSEAVYRASVLLVDYPNDALGYTLRGRAYALQEEHDLALADFSKAIQFTPSSPEGFARRGYVYFEYKKDYQRAFDDVNRAIELGGQVLKWDMQGRKGNLMTNLYDLRAVLYHEFDQLEPALQDINKAIAMASKEEHKGGLPFFLLRRAFIHQDLKMPDAAAEDARQALGLYQCLEAA